MPWWLFDRRRRVPGTSPADYLMLVALMRARGDVSVETLLGNGGTLYRRLLEPLAVAALNTRPEQGLARLMGRVVRETLARGGAACIPSFPRTGLSESFVDPALAWLKARGALLHLGRRVARLSVADGRVDGIETTDGRQDLAAGDAVVLATPAWVAADLLPELRTPDAHEAILNVHFLLDSPREPFLEAGFVGLVGGVAEWVFLKPRRGLGDGQRRGRAGRPPGRGHRGKGLAGGAGGAARAGHADARGPRGQGAPRHLRRHRRPGTPPSRRPHRARQPGTGRGLDRHRPARNHRRCDSFRPHRRHAAPRGMTPRMTMLAAADTADRTFVADALDFAIDRARDGLAARQRPDGHWVFELEADATIPAEYVLLEHFLDRIDPVLEGKIGVYLRSTQAAHGGWPLFHDGAFNISASVKAYFALKAIGDDPEAPHMRRARAAILAAGGAARTNVFTRAQLALFGQVPWRAVPVMPLQIMHLPAWFPFNLDRISYWSRTVLVPLMVLMARRPRARNPRGIHIRELFVTPPEQVRDYIRGPYRSPWGRFFRALDGVVRLVPRRAPSAEAAAVAFVTERLNGEDGLGGIYPAMANAVMMFDVLGYPPDHPDAATAWASGAQAAGGGGRPRLLPALPVAGLGHFALAAHAMAEADSPASETVGGVGGLAARSAGGGRGGRLGAGAAGRAARRLGVPVREPALPGRRRHRRGGHAAAPPGRPGA